MSCESYRHWLASTDLETARESDLLEAVQAVLHALNEAAEDEQSSALLGALGEIEGQLLQGRLPRELLAAFRRDFPYHASPGEDPQAVLERELREIAAGIAPSRWSTETYQNLEQAIDAYLEGGEEEALWAQVETIEQLLERVSESYQRTAVLPKEVTMESLVIHRLLCEGIAEWQQALALLRESEDEPDWDAVLDGAEAGNRLLVAVQIYYQRLQSALSTL